MPQSRSKNSSNLGRAMIKNRFQSKRAPSDQWIAPADATFTAAHKSVNLKSTTDSSDLEEFLASATLAGTEFEAERYNVKLVTPDPRKGVLSPSEAKRVKEMHDTYKKFLSIPRRPHWEKSTVSADLDARERGDFLEWRRQLSEIAEIEGLIVTPYEKNLEVWRQLWRVLERSDIVVQIVDARNPLLYYCEDLAKYVAEINTGKEHFILINKGDLLSDVQRQTWADYFNQAGLKAAFFSALQASDANVEVVLFVAPTLLVIYRSSKKISEEQVENISSESDEDDETDTSVESSESDSEDFQNEESSESADQSDRFKTLVPDDSECRGGSTEGATAPLIAAVQESYQCSKRVLSRDDLLELFRILRQSENTFMADVTTVGFVGYPNVGKSSTLNALMQHKRVSVSATPGKTKHFQTMYVDKTLMLCDCPGLVMPSFASSAADMICNGILPVDQLRDPLPPVNLICSRIPRSALESKYGIQLPFVKEYGVDYEIIPPPTAEEFLNAYASMRGFVTARALPDISRAARHILKDYINGELLYCHAPPGINQDTYHSNETDTELQSTESGVQNEEKHQKAEGVLVSSASTLPAELSTNTRSGRVDREFFAESGAGIYEKRGGINKLSITRMEGALTPFGLPYEQYMENLAKMNILLNRKILADFDIWEPRTFRVGLGVREVRKFCHQSLTTLVSHKCDLENVTTSVQKAVRSYPTDSVLVRRCLEF
ncbi:large subunit GTPase 1 homolog [Paramacrobiotus metropolitanus]|uniref:large subunit GTPase 1 homolog n=1 Tax=Paramacrobiotus metropolitanus TaxID=2943436 RepID=UPI002445D81B|nr:large subunit GTPase 1 homolog [Paramacrobiotus metropolitanus]